VLIRDNGVGMSDRTRQRAFEPFFTTKEVGRGTGLGLASAFAVIRDHGGTIRCESESRKGTTFTIELPATTQMEGSGADLDHTEPAAGRETVLIIDDEKLVRRATRAVLESAGYRVFEASGGSDAVELYRRSADAISLVLLDLSMPRRSGSEVLKELREITPELRTIVFSGLSELSPPPGVRVLRKPVSMNAILAEVREALDE
jgi:CheY-like chemotaxis protein